MTTDVLTLTPAVRAALESATCDGDRLVLASQLDRKSYQAVAKALELMGADWSRKLRAHVFDAGDDAAAAVAQALECGQVVDLKKRFQFYETPPALARELAELAVLRPGLRVCEPSAGRGRVVAALRGLGCEPVAFEPLPANRLALEAMGVALLGYDFLAHPATAPKFDRFVANPPFARGQDVRHVAHMLACTRPGGRVVSVMSPGWRTGHSHAARAFRAQVEALGAEWRDLPPGTFAESGTQVRAGVLAADLP